METGDEQHKKFDLARWNFGRCSYFFSVAATVPHANRGHCNVFLFRGELGRNIPIILSVKAIIVFRLDEGGTVWGERKTGL